MGKSFKKHAFTGFAIASSEKSDKQFANRKMRRSNKREILQAYYEGDEDQLAVVSEKGKHNYSDVWLFAKDGKQYLDETCENYKKYLRK